MPTNRDPSQTGRSAKRSRRRTHVSRLLLVVAWLAVALAAWQSYLLGQRYREPRPGHPPWVPRYTYLRPFLAGEPIAKIVLTRGPYRGRQELFRAHFVLSPTVLHEGPALGQVHIQDLDGAPVILDATNDADLSLALGRLEEEARQAGLGLVIQRGGPRGLALVAAQRIADP